MTNPRRAVAAARGAAGEETAAAAAAAAAAAVAMRERRDAEQARRREARAQRKQRGLEIGAEYLKPRRSTGRGSGGFLWVGGALEARRWRCAGRWAERPRREEEGGDGMAGGGRGPNPWGAALLLIVRFGDGSDLYWIMGAWSSSLSLSRGGSSSATVEFN